VIHSEIGKPLGLLWDTIFRDWWGDYRSNPKSPRIRETELVRSFHIHLECSGVQLTDTTVQLLHELDLYENVLLVLPLFHYFYNGLAVELERNVALMGFLNT
jgi:hypothetical protein